MGSVYQLYVTTKLTNKMNNNAFLVKVLQVLLTCYYLPIIQTEIAFVRGLRDHGSPLQYVRGACGDLCDMSRKYVPWNFLNYTVADIDCNKLIRLIKDVETNSEKYK